jgi:outer membrane protein TolC
VLQNATTFSHLSFPLANTVVTQTDVLVESTHTYNTVLTQGLLTGGYVQFRSFEQHLGENVPTDTLNPAVGPYMDLYLQHNLLQAFGTGVNGRIIRISEKNIGAAEQTFRSQLLNLTANVLNLYWDLVSANNEFAARQHGLDAAQKFYEDTKQQIQIGTLASVELPRAEVEVASRKQDLIIAQANVSQQETALKDVLTRTPDPLVEAARIVPLDRIQPPAEDELPPLRQLVATALKKRPDVAIAKIRDETAEINAMGTENGLLPTLQVYGRLRDRGLAGTPKPGQGAAPYFYGGYGTALGQIFRRDFPSQTGGAYLLIPLQNHQAQGDYGVDQLQLKQSQLSGERDLNQIVVDISNQIVALRQARARYTQAVQSRRLQEQLLAAERQKFSFGVSTITNVIVAQRALVTAETSEVAAQSSYAHARVSLDQVTGQTLDANHVSLEEGLSGHVAREFVIPATVETPGAAH